MTYEDIDFNTLYIKQKESTTFKMKSQAAWDNKAASMNQRVHNSIYNDEFLALVNTNDCQSLLDVGCGVGNLSLKLAKNLETVYALDYSKEMLKILQQNATDENLNNINTFCSSWYDAWDDIPKADIVIASRSLEVKDMQAALEKLNQQALKRVYLSYKVGGTFVSQEILNAMQREIVKKPDYIYVLNILYGMGINATVNFIRSEGRSQVYKDCEHFIESIVWSLGEVTEQEKERLIKYYENHVKNSSEETEYVKWAVISWER